MRDLRAKAFSCPLLHPAFLVLRSLGEGGCIFHFAFPLRGSISRFAAGRPARFVLHYGAIKLRKYLTLRTLQPSAFFRVFPLTILP